MKFAIIGPHGSGKTTILEALKHHKSFESLIFLPEIARNLYAKGFALNGPTVTDTQILILAQQITDLIELPHFVADRSLLDTFVYTNVLYKDGYVDEWLVELIAHILEEYLDRYDRLFYIPSEFDLKQDGIRSTDIQFHTEICNEFELQVETYSKLLTRCKILTVTGSVQSRIDTIVAAKEECTN